MLTSPRLTDTDQLQIRKKSLTNFIGRLGERTISFIQD
jgi:hypothetical protein